MALYSMTLGDIGADGVETVRRKFVPCRRRRDGVLGLYDVSGGAEREGFDPFFTNGDTSGTTSFWSEDADKLPTEYCLLDGWPNRFALVDSQSYGNALFSAAYDAYVFAVNNNNAMAMPAPMDL